ncbi:MAG: hypothetical protein ACRDPQ_19070 [Nocardioidaceae bacterium]
MRALALFAVLALPACGGGGIDAKLRVVVPDNNIREEGIECSGARPFRAVHRGTDFQIRAGGEVVADGELPEGHAVNAEPEVEWGVPRIPTHCVFDLEVELPERQTYELVLPGVLPVEFERRLLGDEPLRLVLSG